MFLLPIAASRRLPAAAINSVVRCHGDAGLLLRMDMAQRVVANTTAVEIIPADAWKAKTTTTRLGSRMILNEKSIIEGRYPYAVAPDPASPPILFSCRGKAIFAGSSIRVTRNTPGLYGLLGIVLV